MSKKICFSAADILVPEKNVEKWSVIACDQYTSEPEYWQRVSEIVGDAPSALNIILPEVYLKDDNSQAIRAINENMDKYLKSGVFRAYDDSIFYVERVQSDGCLRRGIVGKIDLNEYDYTGTVKTAAVRATEKTVAERIPPRVKIRENAPLEMPHVMLLIDDPDFTVIEPLTAKKSGFEKVYDFDMMLGGGHIAGYNTDKASAQNIIAALEALSERCNGLLFCVGDGNHSLATAKECYAQNPSELSQYALVEVVNIHDTSLQFEPIYRVVFDTEPEALIDAFVDYCGGESSDKNAKKFTCYYGNCERELSVSPKHKLLVGALQSFLDKYAEANPQIKVDYIHGEDSLKKLASKENAVGFIFEGIEKSTLFPAVLSDGSLPRKSFSMGHADDKRFYIEARKIK